MSHERGTLITAILTSFNRNFKARNDGNLKTSKCFTVHTLELMSSELPRISRDCHRRKSPLPPPPSQHIS